MPRSGKRKPRATDAFKRDAVRKWRNRGTRPVNEITAELEITSSQLHRWIAEFPEEASGSKRGTNGSSPVEEHRAAGGYADKRGELARLRREVVQLTEECDVLKKTIVVFARTR